MLLLDLALFPLPGSPTTALSLGLATGGQVVTGTQKLAQRFAMELTTLLGSMAWDQARGCEFLDDADPTLSHSEFGLTAAFTRALLVIGVNLQAEESDTDPADERFAGAQLTSLVIATDGGVNMAVTVYSQADVTTIVVPILPQ